MNRALLSAVCFGIAGALILHGDGHWFWFLIAGFFTYPSEDNE